MNLDWYHNWHKNPRHKHVHWLSFFAVLTITLSFLFSELGNFYLENGNQAKAQGNITLGISGDRFTVNGTPQFLIMVSYFDAMAASDTTLDSDFARLRSLGFSGVRIFPDWTSGSNPSQLLDSNGNFRSGALSRLTNILQRAQNNGLIVDLSFDRGLISGSASSMINGLRNTAQAITAYRNVYFDLTNEADYSGITCGTARLCPSEARQARDAVKAVDPQRIVSISLISGSIRQEYTVNGAMDFTLVHGPFSTFNAGTTSSLLSSVKSQIPGLPVHFQEPDRCRSSSCRYSSSEFIAAASEAKCDGAAGWNFHTNGGYDLSGGTMFNNWLDPAVENAVATGLSSALSSVTWFGCAGGNQPPPPRITPTVIRSIYFVTPFSVQSGDTLRISGDNLATTVNFYNSARNRTSVTGAMNKNQTEVTIPVPNIPPGRYSVSVGPNPDSNEVALEIVAPTPPTGQGTTQAIPCDPTIVALGVSVICDFYPEEAYPGNTIEVTGVALGPTMEIAPVSTGVVQNLTGIVSNNGTVVTFILPTTTAPGNYTLGNVGTTGNATITKTLSVLYLPPGGVPNGPPNPNFPGPPNPPNPPPAPAFQDLISNAFNYAVIVVGIAVFIMIMWAGLLWITSGANPGNISRAKGMITNALLGAILLLSAYAILYTINPELVGTTFNLGGIQGPSPQSASTIKVVATSELEAANAIIAGCVTSIDRRDFTAMDCDPVVANSLNLTLDPVIATSDTNVNNQIGATVIQSGGNLGAGRRIVVLDSGYNYNNPDLNSSYLGGNDFVNNDNDPMDDHSTGGAAPAHGSHVAGIITGDGIDQRARGVAPQAGIIAGKILDSAGNGNWSRMVNAIYWAVNGPDGVFGTTDDFRADAINLSVGGGVYNSYCDNIDSTTQLLAKALQYAKDNGVLPIVAAGNISNGVDLPGCIDAAFTVGAVDSSDRIANFSGRGVPVDIVAPGVNVYSTLLGNNYGFKNGTSMATPVVSGAAALIKATNPGYTATQLEQTLTSTACDLGSTGKDSTFGWGRVSLSASSCAPPPPPPPPPGPTGTMTASPTSCTKGIISSNPNCDTNISYTITGITTATQLTVAKDNNFLQNIQCSSSPCNGQFSDQNPNAGLHQYDIRLINNIIAKGASYIFTRGNLTANFGSCQLGNPGNPNCDVILSISAPGVAPNSLVVTRDGFNWRLVPCTSPSCSSSIIDTSPSVGTHTYTIRDSSDNTNGRLGRVTVVINPSPNVPSTCSSSPNEVMELCTGTNYTGTCGQFTCHEKTNFSGSAIAGQMIRSARIIRTGSGIGDARIYTCDTGWVHPNPSSTEPTPCLWLDFNTTTQVPDVWNPSNNNWCYWTWVNGTATTFCGQPVPTAPGINIKSYGSL